MIINPGKKVILITGCSSGFGLRIAARLGAAGHAVFAAVRNFSKQDDLLGEAALRQGKVNVLLLDVTDIFAVKRVVESVRQQCGRIDVLINNAGYGIGGFFEDLKAEEIRAQMETNFFGVQNMTREVLPIMREKRKGLIINMSSVSGLYALPCFGAYNASKWALEGFSESLLFEVAPFGIHVCLIEPGAYRTKIFGENRRYAKNFFNPESPYYTHSQILQKKTNDHVRADKKDPEEVAILVERLIGLPKPPFRNIPDARSRWLYMARRLLPFELYRWIAERGLAWVLKKYENEIVK